MARRIRRSREGTFDQRFRSWAEWLLARGVRPNHFTLLQLPLYAIMAWGALHDRPWLFVGLSFGVIVLDGGDGILARVGGQESRFGAFLDATMDSLGIALVLWGASRFYPDMRWVLLGLFVLNMALYAQNAVLHEKVVSYVRGPVLAPIVFPDTVVLAMVVAGTVGGFLFVTRLPATARAVRVA